MFFQNKASFRDRVVGSEARNSLSQLLPLRHSCASCATAGGPVLKVPRKPNLAFLTTMNRAPRSTVAALESHVWADISWVMKRRDGS